MFYVYIIESVSTSKWYYGHSERPHERLREHNGNHQHYTANKGPWKLIFLKSFENRHEAVAFERKLKALRNKEFISKEFWEYFLDR